MADEFLLPLCFNARKAVSAVIASGRAIKQVSDEIGHSQSRSILEALYEGQSALVRAALRSQKGEPLDSFLASGFESLGTSASLICRDSPELLSAIKNRLTEFASSISCNSCSTQRNLAPCVGKIADDHTVNQDGFCIANLKRQFEAILAATRYFYSENGVPCEQTHRAAFHLEWKHCETYCPDFKTDGYTTRRKDGSFLVVLGIDVPAFNWQAYLGIDYVLFHECVSHCLSNFTDVDSADSFAEGWMDFIAHSTMIECFRGTQSSNFRDTPDLRIDREAAGTKLYTARRDCQDLTWDSRSEGSEAANRFLLYLQDISGDGIDLVPIRCLYYLSFRMNQTNLSAERRRSFVSTIFSHARSAGIPRSGVRHPGAYGQFGAAVVDFARNGDLDSFLQSLPPPPRPRIQLANFAN